MPRQHQEFPLARQRRLRHHERRRFGKFDPVLATHALEETAQEFSKLGSCTPIAGNASGADGAKELSASYLKHEQKLDILVNNAGGVEQLGTYTDMTVAILESALRFNVSAPFELGRHALPHMLARGGGVIVNIGSMAAMQNERGFLPYSLAKSALGKFTQLAAIELAPRIRVNAILPGCIETEALQGFMDAMADVREGLQSKTPMRRNGTPADIAAAALFLASPAASWITGKLLEVDGAAPAGLFPNNSPDL